MLALIVANTLEQPDPGSISNFVGYAFVIIKEFLVGMALGFVSYLIFTAVYLAGQIIDTKIGFGMVNILDPVSNIQVPVTANLYFTVSMLVFLMLKGHHMLIKALCDSFYLIPIGKAVWTDGLTAQVARTFSDVFILGLKISAPIIATILVTDVALGIISRTVPQINVFFVGMPVKILLGMVVMILTIPLFIYIVEMIINGMNDDVYNFMKGMMESK